MVVAMTVLVVVLAMEHAMVVRGTLRGVDSGGGVQTHVYALHIRKYYSNIHMYRSYVS
jgi:hypothetical protein